MVPKDHNHDVVYFGIVNLLDSEEIVGAIDVWRCRLCSKIFCEDKRWGTTELAEEIGFPEIEEPSRWAVLVCSGAQDLAWTLLAGTPGVAVPHECKIGEHSDLIVSSGYDLSAEKPAESVAHHSLFLVENFINRECIIRSKKVPSPSIQP